MDPRAGKDHRCLESRADVDRDGELTARRGTDIVGPTAEVDEELASPSVRARGQTALAALEDDPCVGDDGPQATLIVGLKPW